MIYSYEYQFESHTQTLIRRQRQPAQSSRWCEDYQEAGSPFGEPASLFMCSRSLLSAKTSHLATFGYLLLLDHPAGNEATSNQQSTSTKRDQASTTGSR